MNKDDLLLSEAYAQVVNETIGDRLKGIGAGIGAGLKQGAQNLAGKAASALGANVQTSGDTAGGAYANAQQTSLVNSFIKKAQKEIADFNNDVSKMGVNPNDEQFPEIKKQLDSVNNLIKFLQNPQGPEPVAPAPAASTGGTTPPAAPAQAGGKTPTPAASTANETPNTNKTEDQGQTGNFNANLVGQTPAVKKPETIATQQQATGGGTVQGIPHGVQRNANTNTNTSFSMANPQPVMKQVNELPKQEPVQKAMPKQPEQEAELASGEEAQKESPTQGYVNAMAQTDGGNKTQESKPEVKIGDTTYRKEGTGWAVVGKTGNTGGMVPKANQAEIDKAYQTNKGLNPAIGTRKTY
jgi:co-chaperonin GroES (HSP10)